MGKRLVSETMYSRWNGQCVVILDGLGSGDDSFILAGGFKVCTGIIKNAEMTEIKLELTVLY